MGHPNYQPVSGEIYDEALVRIATLEEELRVSRDLTSRVEMWGNDLEAKLTWAMGLNACIEHARAERAEAELAALREMLTHTCGNCRKWTTNLCAVAWKDGDESWVGAGDHDDYCPYWQPRKE